MLETPPVVSGRRYDIDWLRVIAMWLLIIYHSVVAFQPFGSMILFIQNEEPMDYIWPAFQILNIWRIPILFVISGMGVYFAMRKRSWAQLMGERSRRILLPLVFGSLAIVPLHYYLFQRYNGAALQYWPNPGHLWFLTNIFIYVIVGSPLFFLLKKNPDNFLSKFTRKILKSPASIFLFVIPFIIVSMITNPPSFETYAMTSHGFYYGALCFLMGFYFISLGDEFWIALSKTKYIFLAIAAILYSIRFFHYGFEGVAESGDGFKNLSWDYVKSMPNSLKGLESISWMMWIFGLAHQFLNKSSKVLKYLSPAVYPTYIMHMFMQYAASYFVIPSSMPKELKFVLVVLMTFVGCYVFYEIIKRIKHLRPLFGMNL